MAVAVFNTPDVVGETVARDTPRGIEIIAKFSKLPPGKHGFHIHNAGDLRGEGCLGACSHWHNGPSTMDHGPGPGSSRSDRHTGDLGNVSSQQIRYRYLLAGANVSQLWGRSLIVHADEDDLGLGGHDDSKTTGHSGARIACAVIGRVQPCSVRKTRKR